MIEIRSYRRVFELERRIYRIDRLRLNPGGVPLRGLVYLAMLEVLIAAAARTPLMGSVLLLLPWYLRYLALPAAAAALLGALRIDGRPFHMVAAALAGAARGPRAHGIRPRGRASRWSPPPLIYLPDGSDGRLRGLIYSGPGALRLLRDHRVSEAGGTAARRGRARELILAERRVTAPLAGLRVLVLERGCRVRTLPATLARPPAGAGAVSAPGQAAARVGHA